MKLKASSKELEISKAWSGFRAVPLEPLEQSSMKLGCGWVEVGVALTPFQTSLQISKIPLSQPFLSNAKHAKSCNYQTFAEHLCMFPCCNTDCHLFCMGTCLNSRPRFAFSGATAAQYSSCGLWYGCPPCKETWPCPPWLTLNRKTLTVNCLEKSAENVANWLGKAFQYKACHPKIPDIQAKG